MPTTKVQTFHKGDTFQIRLQHGDVTFETSEVIERIEPPVVSDMALRPTPWTIVLTERGEKRFREFVKGAT